MNCGIPIIIVKQAHSETEGVSEILKKMLFLIEYKHRYFNGEFLLFMKELLKCMFKIRENLFKLLSFARLCTSSFCVHRIRMCYSFRILKIVYSIILPL